MVRALVRAAAREDLPILREIERASGQRYRQYGLDHVADDEPASIEVLGAYAEDGRAWVAVGDTEEPIGYRTSTRPPTGDEGRSSSRLGGTTLIGPQHPLLAASVVDAVVLATRR